MISALVATVNPKGGHGMQETFMFCFLVVVLVFMAYNKLSVPSELQYVIYTVLGYIVGTNKPAQKKKKGDAAKNDEAGIL